MEGGLQGGLVLFTVRARCRLSIPSNTVANSYLAKGVFCLPYRGADPVRVNRTVAPGGFFSFLSPFKSQSLGLDGVFFCFSFCLGPFCQLTIPRPTTEELRKETPFLFSFLQPLLLFHPQTFKTFISILVPAPPFISSLYYYTEGIGRRER